MKVNHDSRIEKSLHLIEVSNPAWPIPALAYFEEIQPRASRSFTVVCVNNELLTSQNEAKGRWSAWFDRLEIIMKQEEYDVEESGAVFLEKKVRFFWKPNG